MLCTVLLHAGMTSCLNSQTSLKYREEAISTSWKTVCPERQVETNSNSVNVIFTKTDTYSGMTGSGATNDGSLNYLLVKFEGYFFKVYNIRQQRFKIGV